MDERKQVTLAVERYDRALRRGRKLSPVPGDCPVPQPTSAWPTENKELLERYRDWLEEGCVAQSAINQHRIPMAGHILGLSLKPHPELDLGADLEAAMDYVLAKGKSGSWLGNSRHSLNWFRRFMRHERGFVDVTLTVPDVSRYQEGLPEWLVEQLEQYQRMRQVNWR